MYTNYTGKRKQKKSGFKTKREAKEYEIEALKQKNFDCNMSFSNLVELYLEDIKPRIKPTTYENKVFMVNDKLTPFFGKIPLNSITATTLHNWQTQLIADKKEYSQTYSPLYPNKQSEVVSKLEGL